jgi:hypothetical protein
MFFWYWFLTSILIPPYCRFLHSSVYSPYSEKGASVTSFLWIMVYALIAYSDIVPIRFSYETHVDVSA